MFNWPSRPVAHRLEQGPIHASRHTARPHRFIHCKPLDLEIECSLTLHNVAQPLIRAGKRTKVAQKCIFCFRHNPKAPADR
jgi:hypothetical protein